VKRAAVILAGLACLCSWLSAAESAVVELVEPETSTPWLGQRLDFAVEVAVEGRFDGATVFDLPELPGAILFKPEDRPVLSSRQVGDREYSVQRHSFALFCQRPGSLAVKGIKVRCGSIAGVGAEPREHRLEVPEFAVEARAQPELLPGQVVVSSRSFEVEEYWDPQPGEAKTGDAFKRTVTITADDVPGMLLPRLPQPDLGAFTGRRSDSVTYLCETGGEFRLPAVRFRCWNPDKKQWIVRELPAATIRVATAATAEDPVTDRSVRWWRVIALLVLLLAGIGFAMWIRRARDTPEAEAFGVMRDACARASPAAAVHAFQRWQAVAGAAESVDDLRVALRAAEEAIVTGDSAWSGTSLLAAARAARRQKRPLRRQAAPALARLNP